MTLVVAAALALISMTAVVGLTWHASSSRDHEDHLDEVIASLNGIQDIPWRVQTERTKPGSVKIATVRAEMRATEREVQATLAGLQRRAPNSALAGVQAPLKRNITALNRMLDLIDAGHFDQAAVLAPSEFTSHDETLIALNRAARQYRSGADGTLWEATVGSIAIVLLVLGGFVFFYLRSYRARTAAEALADELQRSQQHLEQAQNIAGVGSFEWNDDDRVVRWSAEHSRVHGWSEPLPPGRPRDFLALIAPGDRDRVRGAMQECFQEAKPIELEYRVAESRGGRLVHVRATNVIEADGRRRLIGTTQDVTERFRHAEAERANRAKTEFISRMSHELRTPLNAVLGFGQLLSMSELDERQQGNVEHILSAGRHLLDLINEILDISRIESGELRLLPEAVSVESVVGDAVDLVTPVAAQHAISVEVERSEEDLWVLADVQRLRQVLLNLLSNAVKYNHDGGHVRVSASASEIHRIRIVVADDGPGIAPGMLERLFSPFDRLGAEQTSVEGTGLGLAVSRGMIEAMGGRISVSSEHRRGSSFAIELPRGENPTVSRAAAVPLEKADRDERVAPETMKLLSIEGNPTNRYVIQQVLRTRPTVRLISASDGQHGLELARKHIPDVILLDLDLPDMNGEEVLSALKRDRTTSTAQVAVLSERDDPDALDELRARGAASCLTVPINIAALLEVVDEASDALGHAA